MYHRFTSKDTPMSDWGHAMFAEDRDMVAQCYGSNEYLYDGKAGIDIADLKDAITQAWEEDAETGMLPVGYEDLDAETAYGCFNPDDIVMSAGAWDCGEALEWFCERIAEPMGIPAVITSDGAIVFDADLICAA